jgi:colicin import membrane protein
MQDSGMSFKAVFLSVLLHLGAMALLIISIDMNTRTLLRPAREIVQAVAIDNQEVEKELQKLREIEDQKQREQEETERKLKEAEQKLADAERQRRQEELRLADTKKQQEQERLKREQEQQRLAQIKKETEDLERKRKQEEEKKRAEEAERKRQEQLAAEQKVKAAEQAKQDQQLLRNIYASIYNRVKNNFNISGLPPDLKCVISVRVIPGGEIINASINRSSGNDIFDSRALVAVQKASPLPVPADAATLDRLKLRQFLFEFSP